MDNNIVRISVDGGRLILPVDDLYGRELLLEHLARCAKRHRHTQVAMNGVVARVHPRDDDRVHCAECSKPLRHFVCVLLRRSLCIGCLQAMASRERHRAKMLPLSNSLAAPAVATRSDTTESGAAKVRLRLAR